LPYFSKPISEHHKDVAVIIKTGISFKGDIFSYEKASPNGFIPRVCSESPPKNLGTNLWLNSHDLNVFGSSTFKPTPIMARIVQTEIHVIFSKAV
jgi:hypothetical protein